MPNGNANIHEVINVSDLNNIYISFTFCELNRVA